jgi:hypothetical protein
MADESVGYYWNQAAKEREAMERHDREHPGDPALYQGECSICAERVDERKQELEIDKSIERDMAFQKHGL